LTSKAIATHVSGKSREEIRESIINNSDWFSGVLGACKQFRIFNSRLDLI
jgi:hypothetical protein